MNRLIALSLLLGACGPPWAVIRQSGPPSAVAGAAQLAYTSDFNQALLDGVPIGTALGSESAEEQANNQAAFQEMDAAFLTELSSGVSVPVVPAAGPAQPGEVRLTATYVEIQRGARGPIGPPTVVRVRYTLSLGGTPTDEAEMVLSMQPTLTRSSRARRMTALAGQHGRYAASFFRREQGR